ncbi:hypothetical protein [Tropicimonas sp. S265A]|uniref:hypothetical protein n=1 Tax=Tropicimonas sp. S265A TaxID=3415134 RepID=UPI003C7E68EB
MTFETFKLCQTLRWAFSAGVIVAIGLLAPLPAAAEQDRLPTCTDLFNAATNRGQDPTDAAGSSMAESLWGRLFKEEEDDDPVFESVEETEEYRMTVRAGNALFVRCDRSGNKDDLVKLVYHPVGLVLRAVSQFTYNDEKHVLGETENGLSLIFLADDLTVIGPDDAFIVHDDFGNMALCIGGSVTRADPENRCDPFRAQRPNQPRMEGNGGYLHLNVAQHDLERRRKWLEIWLSKDKLERTYQRGAAFEEFSEHRSRRSFCKVLDQAQLYENGNRPGETVAYRAISFSLCARTSGDAARPAEDLLPPETWELAPRRVRIVTLEGAREAMETLNLLREREVRFQTLVFPRASVLSLAVLKGQPSQDVVQALGGVRRKTCDAKLEESTLKKIEGSIGAGVELGVSAKVEFGMEDLRKLTEENGLNTLFNRTAILIVEPELEQESAEVSSQITITDVTMEGVCYVDPETKVEYQKLTEIRVGHPGAIDGIFRLPSKELRDAYKNETQVSGIPNIDELYGEPSQSDLRTFLEEGVFWEIKDHNEYLLWRNALRKALRLIPNVHQGFLLRDDDTDIADARRLDHYVQTLMAAVFVSDVTAARTVEDF